MVRGVERHRQLLQEHFRFHRKRYDNFALANQARQASISKSEMVYQANDYAFKSIFYHKGQDAIRSSAKALDILKKLIDQTSGSEQMEFKQQRAEINRHYLAELLIEEANQKMASLDTKPIAQKIQILQTVKDLYASAMAHESIRQEFYRSERANISLLKTNLETEAREKSRESQLHGEAKSLARIARDNQALSDYDNALNKYAILNGLNPVNIEDYKYERAALYQEKLGLQNSAKDRAVARSKAIQDARAEQDILTKFAEVNALIATTDDLSGQALINCYQNILDKLASIIHCTPQKIDHYKTIRAQIYRQKMDCEQGVNAANIIVEQAQPINRHFFAHPSNQNPAQGQLAIPSQEGEHLELQFNY
jgi:hypothetical protein